MMRGASRDLELGRKAGRFITRHRALVMTCGVAVFGLLVGGDAQAAATAASGGFFGWLLSAATNFFGSLPSTVAYAGVIGGGAGVGTGVYTLYHHINDGGRMAEKTGTILGTGVAGVLMALPLLMNAAQSSATAAGGSSSISKQSVTIQ